MNRLGRASRSNLWPVHRVDPAVRPISTSLRTIQRIPCIYRPSLGWRSRKRNARRRPWADLSERWACCALFAASFGKVDPQICHYSQPRNHPATAEACKSSPGMPWGAFDGLSCSNGSAWCDLSAEFFITTLQSASVAGPKISRRSRSELHHFKSRSPISTLAIS